jgi:hypothetical protein
MPGWPDGTWGNPYRVGRDGTRKDVIAQYRAYVLSRPDLLVRLPELRGKRLRCWCKPQACHADVLAELAEGRVAWTMNGRNRE